MQEIASPPLVVDLDGALLRTDLLQEVATSFATRHPLRSLRLAGWSLRGKTSLTARLGGECELDAACLPYRESLVAWLGRQREQGRRLVLATAFHRSLAERVQAQLGLFDEIMAAGSDTGVSPASRRDLLVERFGERGFDYVGREAADAPVFSVAAQGFQVGSSSGLAKVRSADGALEVLDGGPDASLRGAIRMMRPHQWIKNALVLLPLIFAHRYTDLASVAHVLLALVAFCLLASAAYILNDLIDLAHDRQDSTKRARPLASGEVGLLTGWVLWPLLLIAAFVLAAFFLPGLFVAALASYLVLTLAYSLRLKQTAIIDVLALAALYTLRIVAGAEAMRVQASFWLLAFSVFFFLSLAFVKRYSWLKAARESRSAGVEVAGRGYVDGDLEIVSSLGAAAGYIAVLLLALYINDSRTAQLYRSPQIMWMACPVLLFWITRVWLLAHRGEVDEDPIVFALRDRASWIVAALLLVLFVLARLVP
jgi:4-hydroxybenzoate polyprenyltransferase